MRVEERSELIHDALNFLDDEMIEEVANLRAGVEIQQSRPRPWRKWIALAASICLLVVIGGVWQGIQGELEEGNTNDINMESAPESNLTDTDINQDDANDAVDDEPIIQESKNPNDGKPAANVSLPSYSVNLRKEDGVASDMALLFIYEGRCYVQTCDYMTKDVVGEYVCTTTGLIDEWTEKDGYVEFAGSFEGDIYTVAGVDSEFMLCTVYENGVVESFTHNNGISLGRGDEILEWLGFEVGAENYTVLYKEKEVTDREIFDKFFANFAESEVLLRKDMSTKINAEDIKHVYLLSEEGVPLHFELLGNGYVSYYGLDEVCVKLDKRVYEIAEDILEENK